MIYKIAISLIVVATLSSCAGYDQWAEGTNKKMNSSWTEMLNGKQTVDSTALPKDIVVNIAYGKGEGSGIPGRASSKFYDKLLGDVTYNKNCRNMLMFNVGMFNDAGSLIRTEVIIVGPYTSGIKALINKDVITDPLMQKSSQVTRLVLSGLSCR